MALAAVTIRKKFEDKLKALGDIGSDAYIAAKVPTRLIARIRDRFEREVDPDNVAWKPRADQSNREKLLIKNTTLYESIRVVRNNGRPYTNTGFGFRIGAPARNRKDGFYYGLSHQNGARIVRDSGVVVKIPRRKFLGINKVDVTTITNAMGREADKILKRL